MGALDELYIKRNDLKKISEILEDARAFFVWSGLLLISGLGFFYMLCHSSLPQRCLKDKEEFHAL